MFCDPMFDCILNTKIPEMVLQRNINNIGLKLALKPDIVDFQQTCETIDKEPNKTDRRSIGDQHALSEAKIIWTFRICLCVKLHDICVFQSVCN